MSRALDKDVLEFLKTGDHDKVFRDISGALTVRDDSEPLEIEILGRSHTLPDGESFLQDGNALGIPKLRLVQAFIVARQIMREQVAAGMPCDREAMRAATAVLLLMDAEHLTAAGTRKRILLLDLAEKDIAQSHLRRERIFIDSLLTSRLHRHTKSPTLWSHRRWLMQQQLSLTPRLDISESMRVVMISGERHPRNYYAWCHARWLVKVCQGKLRTDERQSLWQAVKTWCFSHHNDVSGWSFLDHLAMLRLMGDDETTSAAFRETLELAESFQWRNESVRWYLRTTAARLSIRIDGEQELEAVHRQRGNMVSKSTDGNKS